MKSSSKKWKKKFGSRLREFRKNKKYSLAQAAKDLNIHLNTLSKWERGINEPCIESLVELSHYYDVPIEDLVNSNHSALDGDPQFLNLFKLYKNLPNKAQAKFLNIMKDLIDLRLSG